MRKSLIAIAAAAALLLSGCAGGNGDPSPGGPPAASEVDRDARLSIGTLSTPATWDAAKNVGGPEPAMLRLVYDTLIEVDENNELVGGAAESWTTEDGGVSYILTLRDDIAFTDGAPLNAEAVKANLDRALTLEDGTLRASLGNVASVDATDEFTVTITQKVPDVTLPVLLTDRAGMVMAPSSFASGEVTRPVGSGEYVWVAESPGVSVTLDRNPDYRDADHVLLAGVDIRAMEDPVARLNAIRTKAVDMTFVGPEQVDEAKALPGISSFDVKGRSLRVIYVNKDLEPAFGDPDVRMALNKAIDREGIANGVLFGAAEPAYQLRPEGGAGFSEAFDSAITYDPEGARELLQKAGYGEGLSFNFVTQPRFQKEAEAIQASYSAIGVDMTIEILPGAGAGTALWYDKTASIGMANFDGRLDIGLAYQTFFVEGTAYNPSNILDEDLIAMIGTQAGLVDPAERQRMHDDMATLIATSPLGAWPVVWGYEPVLYTDEVVGVKPFQTGFPALKGVGKSQ